MEFKSQYVHAMADQAPKMFRELVKSKKIDQHLQEKSVEAHQLLKELLAEVPKDSTGQPLNPQDLSRAEEIVRQTLIEFPLPEKEQNPEPPDDLPKSAQTLTSRARITASSPALSRKPAVPRPRHATTSLR